MTRRARLYSSIMSVCAGPALLAGSPSAVAQNEQSAVDEEILVTTARRRAESFEDVPITITAFSQSDIEFAGIERPQDFISLTPNVTLVETQNQGNAFITVRGISQARNSEPSVAVLLDGVLMTNPAQFNQELFDVQQIEVLKGPQGAVYGRNAIGGAIVITTKEPGDVLESSIKLGMDSGSGYGLQFTSGGPLADSDNLRFHGAFSYFDTDGYIDNPYLGTKADPFTDMSARFKLLWDINDRLRLDSRVYYSELDTTGFYFNIVGDADNTSLPVRVNNEGINERDLSQVSFKLDADMDSGGTLTAITSFDTVEEITTGDAFDFLPRAESFNVVVLPTFFGQPPGTPEDPSCPVVCEDWNQSQYYDIETFSQEVRYTSPSDQPLRWIVGGYLTTTERFVSTGNMLDTGNGVFPVYGAPSMNVLNPQVTFLADSQDNNAWAIFGDLSYDLTDALELSFSLRYDEDKRENTTLTPDAFLPNVPGFPQGFTGQVRTNTWDEWQPKFTLRYLASDNLTLYGGWSRGFRSGGFNQTGVGPLAASQGLVGVGDLFDAEVAETLEVGFKGQWLDGRLNTNFAVYDTESEGPYFFVFIVDNSTQNLGNIGKVDYQGFELDVTAQVTENIDVYFGYGATDSEITQFPDATVIGNEAPLVSEDTTNLGAEYRRFVGDSGLELSLRADYQRIGDTYWEPYNTTVRSPVNLLDLRIGIHGPDWSLVGWQRNANDVSYNAEFSPGGFVYKGKPRRWGIDFTKRF